eukprot:scaffold3026_cov221-Pinguiococcus_pyrenoidosus.AAC.10
MENYSSSALSLAGVTIPRRRTRTRTASIKHGPLRAETIRFSIVTIALQPLVQWRSTIHGPLRSGIGGVSADQVLTLSHSSHRVLVLIS